MYLDLDRFKRENFKYKAFSMILLVILGIVFAPNISISQKYSLQGTTQGNGLTGADMPVRFSM